MQAEEMSLSGTTPVFGDRSQAGPYIVRSALAAKATTRPHFVDQDQFITVLKGTLWIGKGDVFNPSKLQPIREGGVIYLPANTHYFQVAGSEGEVVVQISGNGPAKSTHTEVDAKGQAVAENGPYPSLAPPPRRRNVDPDLLTPDEIEQMERAAAAAKAAAAKKAAEEKK
jgi:quercetin dioxygenase-like cupin family protein